MKLILIYCFLCRYFFEFGTIIGSYVFLPFGWAMTISALWILWQLLSFRLVKAYDIKVTEKEDESD